MRKQNRLHRLKTTSPNFFFPDDPSFNNVISKMHPSPPQTLTLTLDLTALLSDELLLRILSSLPASHLSSTSLVSKRWLHLADQLRHSLTLLNWSFLCNPSSRLTNRFRKLTQLDLFPAAFKIPSLCSPIVLTRGLHSLKMEPFCSGAVGFLLPFIDSQDINNGLEIVARGCPHLQKLCTVAPLESEFGLAAVALECPTLQELELHRCSDTALRPISAFQNLQILRLVASMKGLYDGPGVSDVGLTILAHGCKRLVRLELGGCEASFDGISAIGRCCVMLEELAVFDDCKMERGWLAAVPYCGNLKTLRLQSCRNIVGWDEPMEQVGCCPTVERLVVQRCQLRDKRCLRGLFLVCENVKEIGFQSCWGLDNDMFSIASICRRVKLLSLEGCSKITTEGLESVLLSWHDLQSLTVVSCNGIKDDNVSPALSGLFSVLKEFKWRPDSRSVLSMSLQGTGMGKKGGKFFRRLRG